MTSHTKPGEWLQRHGWELMGKEPHGYAITHKWKSPYDGKLYTQSYALFEQRNRKRNEKLTGTVNSDSPDSTKEREGAK